MAVTIRNWKYFPAPIGDLASEALDLTGQGGLSLYGMAGRLLNAFTPYGPGTDADTLTFRETAGIDEVRLDGTFSAGSGRVTTLHYLDDVTYTGAEPTGGTEYTLSGGDARFGAATGFSGSFSTVAVDAYTAGYSATLKGSLAVQTGLGRFSQGRFEFDDGTAYRVSGDMRLDATGAAPAFSGTIRGLEMLSDTGKVLATARGLSIGTADFAGGEGSLADSAIFSGDDNVTLGKGGVYFYGWGGNDRIIGGNGGDTIVGGTGKDVLTGGMGDDVFVLTAGGEVTNSYQADQITDFSALHDVLSFDLYVFTALDQGQYFDPVTGALQLDQVFADEVLDYANGTVYYDADGSGTDFDPVAVVRLSGRPDLGAENFTADGFIPG